MNSLVRKNLVLKVAGGTESRFGMLETVREYAHMQLRATGEEARLALALEHAKYFTALAKREAGRVWGAEPEVGITRLEQDYDDLVTALEWARKYGAGEGVRVGPAISRSDWPLLGATRLPERG